MILHVMPADVDPHKQGIAYALANILSQCKVHDNSLKRHLGTVVFADCAVAVFSRTISEEEEVAAEDAE